MSPGVTQHFLSEDIEMTHSITSKSELTDIVVSYLKHTYKDAEGNVKLWQAKITNTASYSSFASFAGDFFDVCAFPRSQTSKHHCYSWTPVRFRKSDYTSKASGKTWNGVWRKGEFVDSKITLAYFDLDNQNSDKYDMVTIDDVAQRLNALGLQHLLYTSYSHTPEKHKVRIVVPLNRGVDYDEMFLLFMFFNNEFRLQLDPSIYDPGDHLYGPCYIGERVVALDGAALDVDAVLPLVETLPDDALAVALKRNTVGRGIISETLTPEQMEALRAQIASESIGGGSGSVSISNPNLCRPAWLDDHDALYNGGSHHQTMMSTLTRIWQRSKRSLTFGELRLLQSELDMRFGNYCETHYGRAVLDADIRSVMHVTGTDFVKTELAKVDLLKQRLQRLRNKTI